EVNEAPVAAEAAPRRRAEAPDREKKAKKKGGGLLIGTLFGVVLGGGGLFAAYYLEKLPADPKTLFGEGSAKNQAAEKPSPVRPDAAPAAKPTPQLARQQLEMGRPAEAVAMYDKCDAEAP